MFKLFGKTEFKVRVNYKSGIQEEFWCTDFVRKDAVTSWTAIHLSMKPISIAHDNIESIWQVGIRKPLFGGE
jgi:hypothetical protein